MLCLTPLRSGGMRFDFRFKSGSSRESSPEPLRIAILGDFGGPVTGAEDRLSGPLRVDFDNFDEVFAKVGATLDLPACEERAWEIKLRFRKLEDFHPDHLLTQSDALAKLNELRAKLLHPASRDAAARELQGIAQDRRVTGSTAAHDLERIDGRNALQVAGKTCVWTKSGHFPCRIGQSSDSAARRIESSECRPARAAASRPDGSRAVSSAPANSSYTPPFKRSRGRGADLIFSSATRART